MWERESFVGASQFRTRSAREPTCGRLRMAPSLKILGNFSSCGWCAETSGGTIEPGYRGFWGSRPQPVLLNCSIASANDSDGVPKRKLRPTAGGIGKWLGRLASPLLTTSDESPSHQPRLEQWLLSLLPQPGTRLKSSRAPIKTGLQLLCKDSML